MTEPDTLTPVLRERIEKLVGSRVESYEPIVGGYTPALRLRCVTANGSFFAKIGVTPFTRQALRDEIKVYAALAGEYLPAVVGWDDDGSDPILVLEDLSEGYWPPPWDEATVDQVGAQIEILHSTPSSLPAFTQLHGELALNWKAVAADPEPFLLLGLANKEWLERALPVLLCAESTCSTAGESLCHWDLRSDNMCLRNGRALFVDWNLACTSNPKLDLGFWLPSLEFEGGPKPERFLPHAPEVAAWVSGFFASRAGLPEIPDAPRVRWIQRQQLKSALAWAIRALELPPVVA